MGEADATPFIESQGTIAVTSCVTVAAVIICTALVYSHLRRLSRTDLQYPIIRIVILVPIYAIASMISLASGVVVAQAATTVRDVYEVSRHRGGGSAGPARPRTAPSSQILPCRRIGRASCSPRGARQARRDCCRCPRIRAAPQAYAVYIFFVLVVDYAGGESAVVGAWSSDLRVSVAHVWPCGACCARVPLDARFLRFCRRVMVQFVLTKVLAAMLSLVMLAAGEFENPIFTWVLFTWYTISYTAALYYLFLFYLGVKPQLKGLRAPVKFAVFKLAVFFTYYVALGVRSLPNLDGGPEKWEAFVTIVCMGLLAPAFWLAFGSAEFAVGGASSISLDHAGRAERDGADCGVVARRAAGICDVASLCRDAVNQFDGTRSSYVMQGETLEGQAERARSSKDRAGTATSASSLGAGGRYNAAGAGAEGEEEGGDLGDGMRDAWTAGAGAVGGSGTPAMRDAAPPLLGGAGAGQAGGDGGAITEGSSVRASGLGGAGLGYGAT